jgi:hypothetical protein
MWKFSISNFSVCVCGFVGVWVWFYVYVVCVAVCIMCVCVCVNLYLHTHTHTHIYIYIYIHEHHMNLYVLLWVNAYYFQSTKPAQNSKVAYLICCISNSETGTSSQSTTTQAIFWSKWPAATFLGPERAFNLLNTRSKIRKQYYFAENTIFQFLHKMPDIKKVIIPSCTLE